MPLTDLSARNAQPKDKSYRLADGLGMYLEVMPNGSKYWRLKYRFAGKEKRLALGVYPGVSLAQARAARDNARRQVAAGTDPSHARQQAKLAATTAHGNTFEILAREWYEKERGEWTVAHATKVLRSLESDIFPAFGARPIANITAPEILATIRRVESRQALATVARLLQRCSSVFRYAIVTGRATYNPCADLKGAFQTVRTKNMARVSSNEVPTLMRKIRSYDGDVITRIALQFMALTFVRTSELIRAQWSEIDWDAAEWRIPAERMKMRDPHIVPLSRQAVALLREAEKMNGDRPYVFRSAKSKTHINSSTMLFALYRLGYHSRMTGHGFRGLASTMLHEQGFSPDVIERQLAHAERNKVRAAYNHAQYLPERRRMMQHWADHLDQLAAG
ncbi:tyrosine-type recombinase/integrase [Ralstonia pseudosolanacearum]|uniref:tyrosine-type recombinase/integrase n=1 Tax=Ralstonia pseudosolanacearum TaxID=1310165 RepID=UPI002675475D|nr:integrase arm-type DNA-binding domain-containing protein [Ralstonia pseudosolanacearum]MDO3510067.1 tyrosine-type recombinase/integrase [Ralstonia pseudosolanacearum]MDO3515064.1 tyrosine-type recombinase/integrase [Ralstonia pseudosolanacearum]MDO3539840.1 tyrosine-type recombinase/integrase [Ralstonia pseudosolanacearum]MDO3608140.1 tyrosine-type recombinase/integrase [Ralstonia pseudosolanacearum]MDO3612603.1 tyrosine-type recombinase/integrase [Ralstonia pseudosolanacearum]